MLGKFFGGFNKWMGKSTDAYMSLTTIITRKLKRGVIYIVLFTIIAGLFYKAVPGGFIPEEDMGYFFVNIQLPDAASLQRSDAIAKEVENILMEYPEIKFVTTASGFSMLLSGASVSNTAFIFASLEDWKERDITAKQLIAKVNARLSTSIKGAQVFAFGPPAIPGLGNGSGFSVMLQDKGGNTPEYLAANTMNFIKAANERPEIGMAFSLFQANVPQRYMDIDREKALKLGIKLNTAVNLLSFSRISASARCRSRV